MKWKPLVYKGIDMTDRFLVSDRGDIYSLKSKKVLRQSVHKDTGYRTVCVSMGGRENKKLIRVHIAVACAFVEGFEEGLVVNHKDGIKTNNTADNLEWVTCSENSIHAVRAGLISQAQKVRCKNTGEIFMSLNEARKWCGLKCKNGIAKNLAKSQAYAGRHPVTKERLTWEYA